MIFLDIFRTLLFYRLKMYQRIVAFRLTTFK